MKWSGAVELQQASSQGGGRPQSGAPSAVRLGGWRVRVIGAGVLSGV